MRELHFDYYMQMDYTIPVSLCHYTIKCLPGDTSRQKVSNLQIELYPGSDFTENADSFGNRQIYGCVKEGHDTFHFRISGDVACDCAEYEEEANEDMTAIFRHPYGLNKPGTQLEMYFSSIPLDESLNAYEKGKVLMHRLHQDFVYEKNCTTMATTAEEAWSGGKGVCQDYAHILIALLHMAGILARYVTGMLIGEGASHAWVEVLSEGRWYGIDPTNDIPVTDSHIRLGVGRDASDCLINRGVMRGGGDQTQTIRVIVSDKTEI